MAGDWIKLAHTTPDKPEVFQMADSLGIDPDAVIGKLIRVWIWADQQTRDGNAPSVTPALLDRLAAVTGFAGAMEHVGWLETTESGVRFVNFERHNGSPSKARALGNQRVRSHRELKRNGNGGGVTKALPEKRREEKNKKSPTDSNGPAAKFTPPSAEEVQEYATEANLTFDVGRFVDHYTANGWKIGKASMKDWKATARNWARDNGTRGSPNGPPKQTPEQLADEAERIYQERKAQQNAG